MLAKLLLSKRMVGKFGILIHQRLLMVLQYLLIVLLRLLWYLLKDLHLLLLIKSIVLPLNFVNLIHESNFLKLFEELVIWSVRLNLISQLNLVSFDSEDLLFLPRWLFLRIIKEINITIGFNCLLFGLKVIFKCTEIFHLWILRRLNVTSWISACRLNYRWVDLILSLSNLSTNGFKINRFDLGLRLPRFFSLCSLLFRLLSFPVLYLPFLFLNFLFLNLLLALLFPLLIEFAHFFL